MPSRRSPSLSTLSRWSRRLTSLCATSLQTTRTRHHGRSMHWIFSKTRLLSMIYSTNRWLGIALLVAVILASASVFADPLRQARLAADQHRFTDARAALTQAIERMPRNAEAWLGIASVALVQGDAMTGLWACRRVAALADPIAGFACRGRVALITGHYATAYPPLVLMLDSKRYAGRKDRFTVWARSVAADLAAAMGENAAADRHFQHAIDDGASRDVKLRYLDHLLATNRPEAVLALTDANDWTLQLPRLLALRALNRLDEAPKDVAYLDRIFQMEIRAGEFEHGREMARFYLDVLPQPRTALLAAERNLEMQREPEDLALWIRARSSAVR